MCRPICGGGSRCDFYANEEKFIWIQKLEISRIYYYVGLVCRLHKNIKTKIATCGYKLSGVSGA